MEENGKAKGPPMLSKSRMNAASISKSMGIRHPPTPQPINGAEFAVFGEGGSSEGLDFGVR